MAQPFEVGSAKSNVGHLEAASGVTGLIKVVLAMQHKQLPASLHVRQPTPAIPWERLPVRISTQLHDWAPTGGVRRAGVSAFGFSGMNAHAILEQAPAQGAQTTPAPRSLHVLTLSGRSETALVQSAQRHADFLASEASISDARLADICATAATGRAHFVHRVALMAPDAAWPDRSTARHRRRHRAARRGARPGRGARARGLPVHRARFAIRRHGTRAVRHRACVSRHAGALRCGARPAVAAAAAEVAVRADRWPAGPDRPDAACAVRAASRAGCPVAPLGRGAECGHRAQRGRVRRRGGGRRVQHRRRRASDRRARPPDAGPARGRRDGVGARRHGTGRARSRHARRLGVGRGAQCGRQRGHLGCACAGRSHRRAPGGAGAAHASAGRLACLPLAADDADAGRVSPHRGRP